MSKVLEINEQDKAAIYEVKTTKAEIAFQKMQEKMVGLC